MNCDHKTTLNFISHNIKLTCSAKFNNQHFLQNLADEFKNMKPVI